MYKHLYGLKSAANQEKFVSLENAVRKVDVQGPCESKGHIGKLNANPLPVIIKNYISALIFNILCSSLFEIKFGLCAKLLGCLLHIVHTFLEWTLWTVFDKTYIIPKFILLKKNCFLQTQLNGEW